MLAEQPGVPKPLVGGLRPLLLDVLEIGPPALEPRVAQQVIGRAGFQPSVLHVTLQQRLFRGKDEGGDKEDENEDDDDDDVNDNPAAAAADADDDDGPAGNRAGRGPRNAVAAAGKKGRTTGEGRGRSGCRMERGGGMNGCLDDPKDSCLLPMTMKTCLMMVVCVGPLLSIAANHAQQMTWCRIQTPMH
jgi:hypothetical protein